MVRVGSGASPLAGGGPGWSSSTSIINLRLAMATVVPSSGVGRQRDKVSNTQPCEQSRTIKA
jgi:hypothetical protein